MPNAEGLHSVPDLSEARAIAAHEGCCRPQEAARSLPRPPDAARGLPPPPDDARDPPRPPESGQALLPQPSQLQGVPTASKPGLDKL